MFDDDEKPIRYHLDKDFVLDPGERVSIEKLDTGTTDWVRQFDAPEDAKTPDLLDALLHRVALDRGGEAWRAVTERGELLRVFSVYDFADELSGKEVITMHPRDQYFLGVAHGWLDLPPPC